MRASRLGSCVLVCEQYVRSVASCCDERMAREIEAEHFLLHRQLFFLGKLGHVRQRRSWSPSQRHRRRRRTSPRWPLLRSASTAAPLCIARSMAAINCERLAPSDIERAGLDQRFDRRPAAGLRIDPLAEIEQAREIGRPVAAPRQSLPPRRCRSL